MPAPECLGPRQRCVPPRCCSPPAWCCSRAACTRSRSVPRECLACSPPSEGSPGSPRGCCLPGECGARVHNNGTESLMSNRTLSLPLLGGCALALALAAVRGSPAASAGTSDHAQIGAFGLDLTGGDPSVKPGDDFARHANGRWLDTAQI